MAFFPKQQRFWLYHAAGVGVVFLFQLVAFLMRGDFVEMNVTAAFIWLPLFTLAVLVFRTLYTRYNGANMGMGKLIPIALIYGLVSGLTITTLIFLALLPFFGDEMFNPETLANIGISETEMLVSFFVGNTFIQMLYMSGWTFIYTSTVASRRAKQSELDNLRLQNNLRESQLSNLANQLNPHFLFNSLNNIRFVIHENPNHADAMVTALSEILRYSLASTSKPKVTLEEELGFIERYISIVKLQLEDRLRFNLRVSSQLKHCLVPPMILQLLIENAVKHGMENLPSGGDLDVTVAELSSKLSGKLSIVVTNPIPVSKANADGTGTGLKNIQHRLQLLYGSNASIKLEPSATHFTVHLILPIEKNDESTHY